MCGIAGLFDTDRRTPSDELGAVASRMASVLRHRGPDDGGAWVDATAGAAFGHRRLAVIELSDLGAQPMRSADHRFVIAYNGELYNHLEMRDELRAAGHRFRGSSDTEVLLEAIAAWGVRDALARVNGMFAFALFDRRERELWLGRDRMGEKPLYYTWIGSTFVFASELHALTAHPRFRACVDPSSVAAYLRFGYVPTPDAIYRGVAKLPPGHLLRVDGDRSRSPEPYWSVESAVVAGQRDPLDATPAEIVDRLHVLLADSVRRRMVADVPLGAFLSGGVDSSLMVSLMQEQHRAPVRTFSVGFDDAAFDEAPHAAAVARHLGTEHVEVRLGGGELIERVRTVASLFDEPFADSSQLPTHLVAELARRHVTVAISGDGGDELFAGYDRYRVLEQWPRIERVPLAVRRAAGRALGARGPRWWSAGFDLVGSVLPASRRVNRPGQRLQKIGRVLTSPTPEAAYGEMVSLWPAGSRPTATPWSPSSWIESVDGPAAGLPLLAKAQLFDLLHYLPDDILTKVDRTSMAVSLEARVPLLDHRVVELACRVPRDVLYHDGRGKWPLRALLQRFVPASLVDRPKMGFGVPIGDWLRGPLRPWAEDLLDRSRLEDAGLDPTVVRAQWSRHLTGASDATAAEALWAVVALQAWLDQRAAGERSVTAQA